MTHEQVFVFHSYNMSSDTYNVKDVYTNDLKWCTQPAGDVKEDMLTL